MTEHAHFDPVALIRHLAAAEVSYVLIGGLAAQAHGSPSATFDLDIVPSFDRSNLDRLAEVLAEIDAVRRGVPTDAPRLPPLDARTLRAGALFTLETRYGQLDVLASPDPGIPYEALMRTAEPRDLFGDRLFVASLDDLILMKRAAGRPKDRVELEILGALREEIDRREP